MRWWRTQEQQAAQLAAQDFSHRVLALEDNAVRAGCALACSYANSGEYEAELIAVRRAAGAYGPKRNARWLRIAAVMAGIIAVIVLIVRFA